MKRKKVKKSIVSSEVVQASNLSWPTPIQVADELEVSEFSVPVRKFSLLAGRYQLERSLGSGVLGEVFYAQDLKFDPPRPVAVKVLHTELLSNVEMCEQLRHEAGVTAQFTHPNILRIIDFEITSEQAYIVTEYASGGSLRQKLKPDPTQPAQPLPFNQISIYLEQLCRALDEAHQRGMVHRDLKPENILLDSQGHLLLADFSLALSLDRPGTTRLIKTVAWGTPEYAAPEVWQGKAGQTSDIYALGVVLYEFIAGVPPWQGDTDWVERQHTNAAIPPLKTHQPELEFATQLDTLLKKVLYKNPRGRPKSAGLIYNKFNEITAQPAFINQTPTPLKNYTVGSKNKTRLRIGASLGIVATLAWLIFGVILNEVRLTYSEHTAQVWQVGWSPDGSQIASGAGDDSVRLWDSSNGATQLILRGYGGAAYALSWSSDGKVLASAGQNGLIRLTDAKDRSRASQNYKAHSGPIRTLAWSPDGTKLASGGDDNLVKVWGYSGLQELKLLYSLTTHIAPVYALSWSPDNRILVTGSADQSVQWWRASDGKYQRINNINDGEIRSLAWSPDSGKLAVGTTSGSIWYLDSSGRLLDKSYPGSVILGVSWSPDNLTLAFSSKDGRMGLERDSQILRFISGTESAPGLAWSPDGKTIAIANLNTIRLIKISG